jgi:3-oxoadipate enol-lactonase
MNGVTVEYRQDGRGPDLLLLHSLLTEMSVFDRVLPPLARTHRVTCLNLPGFGASDPVELNSVGEYADHVARVMDALSLPPTVDVFGNGFGAFVALELAIRHGTRIGRLMVADTAPGFPEPAKAPFRGMAEKVRTSGISAILDTAIGRMFPAALQAAHPEVVAARKAALAPADAACFARACLALAALDLRSRLASIRNPTRSDDAARACPRSRECHSRRALSRHRGLGTLPDARATGGARLDARVVYLGIRERRWLKRSSFESTAVTTRLRPSRIRLCCTSFATT